MKDIKNFILESLINENKLQSNDYYINDATAKYKNVKEVIDAFKKGRCPVGGLFDIMDIAKLSEDNIKLTSENIKEIRKKYKDNSLIFISNNKGIIIVASNGFESLFDIENGIEQCDWILKTNGGYHSNGKDYSYKEKFEALIGLTADIYEYDEKELVELYNKSMEKFRNNK